MPSRTRRRGGGWTWRSAARARGPVTHARASAPGALAPGGRRA
ncbi:hypothetical protein D187_001477 [Cystobacter fuscus DSM 2262]|uniref:Uncharacterized protein n=1 Tax=Cystobacter fuscus (strain ATCC 25194 / DSM 2262 / NBRC 100088 / M29) TaxID=1242864 RepID=S9PCJ5_CYSF2|nr:hypothetical protein D187_001477 [Cystobacter fuscus DSM 2262]